MSASRPNTVGAASSLNDVPQFDLSFEFDDPVEPTAVTVYDPSAVDETTSWITVDAGTAIDVVDVV